LALASLGETMMGSRFDTSLRVIIASGLMAGGALGGVIGAGLRLIPGFSEDWIKLPFYSNEPVSQSISALCFVALCFYVWYGSIRKPKEVKWTR